MVESLHWKETLRSDININLESSTEANLCYMVLEAYSEIAQSRYITAYVGIA